jgi:hypothetical protein
VDLVQLAQDMDGKANFAQETNTGVEAFTELLCFTPHVPENKILFLMT